MRHRPVIHLAWALALALLAPVSSAQTPVASPSAGLQPPDVILRVEEGAGYELVPGMTGKPLMDEGFQYRDGAPALDDFSRLTATFYTDHNVRDVYSYSTNLTDDDIETVVTINTRIVTFPDAASAASFVADIYDFAVVQGARVEGAPKDLARIEDLPPHDEEITGWTETEFYSEIATGEGLYPVPSYRFVAQVGDRVASVKVYGTSDVVTRQLAESLLTAQLACLRADGPCQPIPFPDDVSATPVANTRSVSRS